MRPALRVGMTLTPFLLMPGPPGIAQEAPSPFNPEFSAGGFLGYQNPVGA